VDTFIVRFPFTFDSFQQWLSCRYRGTVTKCNSII